MSKRYHKRFYEWVNKRREAREEKRVMAPEVPKLEIPIVPPGLTVRINLMDLDPIQQMLTLIMDIVSDQRIPAEIRLEYVQVLNAITANRMKIAEKEAAAANG